MKPSRPQFELLSKHELRVLCDRLLTNHPDAVEASVEFLSTETKAVWHGRARAMMARRLKHCQLSAAQRGRVVGSILDRFASGRFSEQFKDQLRLVLSIDRNQAFTVARSCLKASSEHVRRYAAWILSHEDDGRPVEKRAAPNYT